MLANTFSHLPGIGLARERSLWKSGIHTWDQLENTLSRQRGLFNNNPDDLVKTALDESRSAFERKDYTYFARRLPRSEHYRIALSAADRTAFLDLETTGLSHHYHEVTIFGLFWGNEYIFSVQDASVSKISEIIKNASCLVTFNGTLFDLKFIRRAFPQLEMPPAHVDLRFLARRVGLSGGQKEIEQELGIFRAPQVNGLLGEHAPVLWYRYKQGDLSAIEDLLAYNRADILGMQRILRIAVERLLVKRAVPTEIYPKSLPWDSSTLIEASLSRTIVAPYRKKKQNIILQDLCGAMDRVPRVVGIDLTGAEKRLTGWALLAGQEASTARLATDDELFKATIDARADLVSIDSPLSLPIGRLSVSDDDPGRSKFGIMRECERILKRRGVNVYPCLIKSMQDLTARGIRLAQRFRGAGIPVIESFPGAAQDILGIPRKRDGLDLLRSGLIEFGLRGEFEHTAKSHDELDAITSALVGFFFLAGRFEALGNEAEDYLIIPDLVAEPQWSSSECVIGISGAIAAGKTSGARWLEDQGFKYVRFSEVLRDLLKSRGENVKRDELQRIGWEVHDRKGQRWLGTELIKRIGSARRVVVDGLRFREDHAFLMERFGPTYTHVHVSASRLLRRVRYDKGVAAFEIADRHSVEREVDQLAALAHHVIDNSASMQQYYGRLAAIVDLLESRDRRAAACQ